MNETRLNILVAEDNPALGSVVRFNLSQAGYDVELVRNGRLAWEAVQERSFDLIVSDQQMPEMNGCEFIERMRQLDGYSDTPVFLLTAKGLELDLGALRDQLGITAAFAKPFSPSEIVREVERVLATTDGEPERGVAS